MIIDSMNYGEIYPYKFVTNINNTKLYLDNIDNLYKDDFILIWAGFNYSKSEYGFYEIHKIKNVDSEDNSIIIDFNIERLKSTGIIYVYKFLKDTDITINGILNTTTFDKKGGIIPLMSPNILINGVIDVTGKGYTGGIKENIINNTNGYSGCSFNGNSSKTTSNNYGGGGGGAGGINPSSWMVGGGGGGGSNVGAGGTPTHGGAKGGVIADSTPNDFYKITMGSGGGAGGQENSSTGYSGEGGNGGGIVVILTQNLNINGNIIANGQDGRSTTDTGYNKEAGAGGGGGGGCVLINTELDSTKISITGGNSGSSIINSSSDKTYSGTGGIGSIKRIKSFNFAVAIIDNYIHGKSICENNIDNMNISQFYNNGFENLNDILGITSNKNKYIIKLIK